MFVLSSPFVKTVNEWKARSPRRSADAAARRFARDNMVATIMHGDDSATLYLYDVANDRIATARYAKPEWVA